MRLTCHKHACLWMVVLQSVLLPHSMHAGCCRLVLQYSDRCACVCVCQLFNLQGKGQSCIHVSGLGTGGVFTMLVYLWEGSV